MLEKIAAPLAGSLLAGLAASACCVGPLVLLLLGFGGAWIALFIAYQRIYRPKPEQPCEEGEVCAKPQANKLYKRLFIGVLVVVVISIAAPYLVPLMYG